MSHEHTGAIRRFIRLLCAFSCLFYREGGSLLVFVGLLVCSEIDRMTDVFRTVKNVADGFSAPAMQLSVLVTIIPTL